MADILKIDGAGEVIRRLREEAGIGLNQLAASLGWDKGRISKYENNHLALALPVIEDIAEAIGLRPEVVVLECLKHRYPTLAGSKIGHLLASLIDKLGDMGR